MKILVVPGYTGSGPEHWQSRLQGIYEGVGRVEQREWEHVDREEWIASLDSHVHSIKDDVLLVGHSCGSVTVAQWSASRAIPAHVRGAILVAPADVEAEGVLTAISAQRPLPTAVLPLRHTIVASTDDPFLSQDRAAQLAATWGSQELIWVQDAGHLAIDDGYGEWPGIVQLIERETGPLIKKSTSGQPGQLASASSIGH